MSKSNRLVFWGTEGFSLPALRRLIAGGWDIAAVVTKPDAKAGRGRKLKAPAVKAMAQAAGMDVLQPAKPADIHDKLAGLGAAHGILAAYGKLIPQSIIDLFPGGIINIHPSLLPVYRGPSPIEAAILNGDKTTGISLMRLAAGMDEGPVYAQKTVAVPKAADAAALSTYLAELGAEFLIGKLPVILDGSLAPNPQDSSHATYTRLIKKEDGLLDFNQSAEALERQVRAYVNWPKSRAAIHGHEVIVTKARVAQNSQDGHLVIKCQPGYLEILELVGPSGRTMNGADFLRGYSH